MDSPRIQHPVTNENVKAIIAGLEPNSTDKILAVCGSGDVAFALLEYADVVAVDISHQQVLYALGRKEALQKGDNKKFLSVTGKELTEIEVASKKERNNYFLEGDRMKRISKRLSNLTILLGDDLTSELRPQTYSKVYLSNILGINSVNFSDYCRYLREIGEQLRKPSLIYISEKGTIDQGRLDAKTYGGRFGNLNDWPTELTLDQRLSTNAKNHETFWKPEVYKFNAK
ncbi:MAG: hypothetical protein ACI8Y7_000607 [Candidatus Woesearchaeota archaeon]|jgi:hypothetical protein